MIRPHKPGYDRKRKFILQNGMTLVVALALAAPGARAQGPARAAQSATQPGAEAMDAFAAIAPAMQELVDAGKVSGVVTLVANRDRVLHLAAVGKNNLETGRAMKADDIFWIASMTKPIVACAIASLVDEGKLSFDDPVEKHLPEFKGLMVDESRGRGRRGGRGRGGDGATSATATPAIAAARPITIRDLLTHTSGMGDFGNPEPHWTLEQTVDFAAKQPLRFQPGSRWAYSTSGINVCGRIVEVVSGMPFDLFLDQRFFEPLGMKDTAFWLTPEQNERLAASYMPDPATGKLTVTKPGYMYNTEPTDRGRPPLGGAGLFSKAEDIGRFYQMLLNNGTFEGKQCLKPETLAEMTKVQTGDLTARPGMPWGIGFCIVADPSAMEANKPMSAGSFGHGGAFGTASWIDPARGIVKVMMVQRDKAGNPDDSEMHRAFERLASEGADKLGLK